MVSSTVIHCPFDVAFIPRGVVSRSQLCLRRKLVFCQAKQFDSVLNGLVREERGSIPVDVIDNFPRLADTSKSVVPASAGRNDVTVVLRWCPQIMNLSIEANLKPYTEFFLKNGFSVEDVGTMISRFGALYSYSLKANVVPKWEFLFDNGLS